MGGTPTVEALPARGRRRARLVLLSMVAVVVWSPTLALAGSAAPLVPVLVPEWWQQWQERHPGVSLPHPTDAAGMASSVVGPGTPVSGACTANDGPRCSIFEGDASLPGPTSAEEAARVVAGRARAAGLAVREVTCRAPADVPRCFVVASADRRGTGRQVTFTAFVSTSREAARVRFLVEAP